MQQVFSALTLFPKKDSNSFRKGSKRPTWILTQGFRSTHALPKAKRDVRQTSDSNSQHPHGSMCLANSGYWIAFQFPQELLVFLDLRAKSISEAGISGDFPGFRANCRFSNSDQPERQVVVQRRGRSLPRHSVSSLVHRSCFSQMFNYFPEATQLVIKIHVSRISSKKNRNSISPTSCLPK